MQIILRKAVPDDRPLFDRLAQLYAYDFSEMTDLVIGSDGIYASHECFEKIWSDPKRFPYLIICDGEPAGFAIVYEVHPADHEMEQFFVLRKFRCSGVGRHVALKLFATHKGKWEVEELSENPAAQAFWRKVIAEFTGGDFTDSFGKDPVQKFVSG